MKTDCIVLDFGTSSLIHGTLEQDADLDGKTESGDAPTKTCPACEAEIPLAAMECPLCGEVFALDVEEPGEGQDVIPLSGFIMSEIDLLKRSSFSHAQPQPVEAEGDRTGQWRVTLRAR